ncbi:hypothetical protein B0H17DRAFT_1150631 [Mycena rosella]|uniref:Uncharacterized protein n=1 Tax=Mycena rosella TaxID=1033263 RepID=A0AAD7FMY3_MYCRO|nr:hypothetical protein B0H17DRAFT_1150631 [Mycena rosella]
MGVDRLNNENDLEGLSGEFPERNHIGSNKIVASHESAVDAVMGMTNNGTMEPGLLRALVTRHSNDGCRQGAVLPSVPPAAGVMAVSRMPTWHERRWCFVHITFGVTNAPSRARTARSLSAVVPPRISKRHASAFAPGVTPRSGCGQDIRTLSLRHADGSAETSGESPLLRSEGVPKAIVCEYDGAWEGFGRSLALSDSQKQATCKLCAAGAGLQTKFWSS